MKKMSDNEVKKNLVVMLEKFDKICRDNDIKYSLIGGSLIGAIRHHGIIPWDDDIDVILERNEYLKLLDVVNNYDDERYMFLSHECNRTYYYPFLKMIDKYTFVKENDFKVIDDYGEYIDIFFYHSVPSSSFLLKIYWWRLLFLKKMIGIYGLDDFKGRKFALLKRVINVLTCLVGIDNILMCYDKLMRKKYKSNFVISNWPCYGLNKEIQLLSKIHRYIDVDFEKIRVMIFKDYNNILNTSFGDYMKLPPVEERINHNLNIYFRDDK